MFANSKNEIIEDQGNLTVYGLTEQKFLDSLDSLGLDWKISDFYFHHLKLNDCKIFCNSVPESLEKSVPSKITFLL